MILKKLTNRTIAVTKCSGYENIFISEYCLKILFQGLDTPSWRLTWDICESVSICSPGLIPLSCTISTDSDTLHACPWDSRGWKLYRFPVVSLSGNSCDHENSRAIWEIFLTLCTSVHSGSMMNFIYFEGHMSKVRVTAASCRPHLRTWNRLWPKTTSFDQKNFTFGSQRLVSLWTEIFWAQGYL